MRKSVAYRFQSLTGEKMCIFHYTADILEEDENSIFLLKIFENTTNPLTF